MTELGELIRTLDALYKTLKTLCKERDRALRVAQGVMESRQRPQPCQERPVLWTWQRLMERTVPLEEVSNV